MTGYPVDYVDINQQIIRQGTCPHPLNRLRVQTVYIGCCDCGKTLTVEEYGRIWARDHKSGKRPIT